MDTGTNLLLNRAVGIGEWRDRRLFKGDGHYVPKNIGSRVRYKKTAMAYFDNDETGYREWVKNYPEGFVLVSGNPPAPNYITIHRADCHTINPAMATHKDYWTIRYVKVCEDALDGLTEWATQKWGSGGYVFHRCKHCVNASRL